MPKVTEAHLEARRQQILDAAVSCFARQGFHQTTMQDICDEAELSPGAVYRYFTGKDDIIVATFEGSQHIDLGSAVANAQKGDVLAVMDELANAAFDDFNDPECVVTLPMIIQGWSEAMRNPELRDSILDNMIGPWRDALTQMVERAQADGKISSSMSSEAVARVLLSTWQGLVLQTALDPDIEVSEYLDVVKAIYRGTFSKLGQDDGQRVSSEVTAT